MSEMVNPYTSRVERVSCAIAMKKKIIIALEIAKKGIVCNREKGYILDKDIKGQ